MKKIEWFIAAFLVVIGLSCLTMSATVMMRPESIQVYLSNLFKICLWTGLPVFIAGVVYFVLRRKKRDESK